MNEIIMIAEDDRETADLLDICLSGEGYRIIRFSNGRDFLEQLKTGEPDLVLLGRELADMDGFAVCREIRKEYVFPVILISPVTEESDLIMGLSAGADDYITRPFRPIEILARVRAQIRRYTKYNPGNPDCAAGEKKEEYNIRGLIINNKKHKCSLDGKQINLTPIEFNILWYLCAHRGNVVSTEELFEAVWGEKFLDNNNTVMTHIGRLREKLKEPARNPEFIKTVWGVGYQIE